MSNFHQRPSACLSQFAYTYATKQCVRQTLHYLGCAYHPIQWYVCQPHLATYALAPSTMPEPHHSSPPYSRHAIRLEQAGDPEGSGDCAITGVNFQDDCHCKEGQGKPHRQQLNCHRIESSGPMRLLLLDFGTVFVNNVGSGSCGSSGLLDEGFDSERTALFVEYIVAAVSTDNSTSFLPRSSAS